MSVNGLTEASFERKRLQVLGNGLEFRVRKNKLGIVQRSIQCQTNVDAVTTTLRIAGMPSGSPQDLSAPFLTSATTIIISSTNTNDTILGTGVRKIHNNSFIFKN